MMKRFLLAATTVLFAACQVPTSDSDSSESASSIDAAEGPVYVRVPKERVTQQLVKQSGFIRDHKRDDVYAFGYMTRAAMRALPSNVRADLVEVDAFLAARADFDAKAPPPTQGRGRALAEMRAASAGYHDYTALTAELETLAQNHPGLATLSSAGKSVEGRDLWYLTISDNASVDEGEPKLLYIANMHGDEVVGRELMLDLARELLTQYGTDERITKLVDNAQIFIMPSMNPDGFERRSRFNANWDDLNRSFPDFTDDPNDDDAGRPPEVRAIMALHAQHHFLSAINFHGGELCFNLAWDTKPNTDGKFGDDPFTSTHGREYISLNPPMQSNDGGSFDHGLTYGYEWYEVNGGMQDWANYYRRSIHSTVELSMSKWPNGSTLGRFWNENREALIGYLESSLVGIHLDVRDEAGEPVTESTVRVSSADRDVVYRTNRISRPAIGGEQQVTVTATGFAPLTVTLTPHAFDGTYAPVVLSRE